MRKIEKGWKNSELFKPGENECANEERMNNVKMIEEKRKERK